MFNSRKIKELENTIENLHNRIVDLDRKISVKTNILFRVCNTHADYEEVIPVKDALEKLLKILGYEIKYEHKPEVEQYLLEKVIKKKKIRKGVKK